MRCQRVFVVISVIGTWLALLPCAVAQCAVGSNESLCSQESCSSNRAIFTPILEWGSPGIVPEMAPVYCCGTYNSTLVGYSGFCYYAELRDPKVQEQLVELSQESSIYVPTCDGWLRPFHPLKNRSEQPTQGRIEARS